MWIIIILLFLFFKSNHTSHACLSSTWHNNLSIQGGNLRNNDGDIKMSNTQIQGGYKIDDTDGDILVSRVTVDGYRVQSNDGDVRLFEQTTSNGNVLEKNSN